MSRKSFRKSKGRKTRSMRKRTMGGADGEEFGLGVLDEKLEELQALEVSDSSATIDLTEVVGKDVESCLWSINCQKYKWKKYVAIHNSLLKIEEDIVKKAKVTAKLDGEKIKYDEIKNQIRDKINKHKEKGGIFGGGRKSRRKRKSRRR